ncbi:hypothetical protein AQB9606_03111 [Aquabacterium sp. CECT 9606]|nr:hypothetical protein AQB9606_03111 [Aquabacterium sp. CECT 9606]
MFHEHTEDFQSISNMHMRNPITPCPKPSFGDQ